GLVPPTHGAKDGKQVSPRAGIVGGDGDRLPRLGGRAAGRRAGAAPERADHERGQRAASGRQARQAIGRGPRSAGSRAAGGAGARYAAYRLGPCRMPRAVAGCAPRLPGELQPQPRGGACAPDARHAGPEGVAGIPSFGRRNHPLAGLARPGPGSRAGWRAIGDTLPPLFFPKPDRSPVSTDRQGAAEAARDSRVFNRIVETLASELDVAPARIRAAIELFDEGATVPFLARYRKEATGGA